jgi:hypothetical protein
MGQQSVTCVFLFMGQQSVTCVFLFMGSVVFNIFSPLDFQSLMQSN